MGLYSAKKPYHNLKASIADFYRQRVNFMKALVQKFSEFEKPYIDTSYPEMNLKIPDPNWPTWTKPYVPNPWHPEISLEPLPPGAAPGPIPDVWNPPPDLKTGGCSGGCSVSDIPLVCEPGEIFVLWIWGPHCNVEGKIINRASATLTIDGPGKLTTTSGVTPFMTVLVIDDDAEDGEWVCVHAETSAVSNGFGSIDIMHCGECALVSACDCSGATIDYTTLQMSVSEEQTLYSSDGKPYDWVVEIGDETTEYENETEIVVTSPDSNPNCDNNITVTMQCSSDDVCDSIGIAVNAVSLEACKFAYKVCCGENFCCPAWHCYQLYDCAGNLGSDQSCGLFGPCQDKCAGEIYTQDGNWGVECATPDEDLRTEDMIADGCCPSYLM